MSERSTETTVTFTHPFQIGGLDQLQPPGTYLVVTEEALLDGLSFPAWHRTATLLHLPAIATAAAMRQAITIDPEELAMALVADDRPRTVKPVSAPAGEATPKAGAPSTGSVADGGRR